MITVPLDDVEPSTIHDLLNHRIGESRGLDYKRECPGQSDPDRTSFLQDVAAFANSGGGHIIYGIEENGGLPKSIPGLSLTNLEGEILRLTEMARDGIDPRIPGVRARGILGLPNGPVIVLEIPRSWIGPHMIIQHQPKRTNRQFYARSSAGNYAMDVREIRDAFARSEDATVRLRQFRDERIDRITRNGTPVFLNSSERIIIHVLPLAAAFGHVRLEPLEIAKRAEAFRFMGMAGQGTRYNLDGYLLFSTSSAANKFAYAQFFRNGCVEVVDAMHLQVLERDNPLADIISETGMPPLHLINGQNLCSVIEVSAEKICTILARLNVSAPCYLFVTLAGVKDTIVLDGPDLDNEMCLHEENYRISDSILSLPEVQIDSWDEPVKKLVKPIADAIWQSSGRAFCPQYSSRTE